MTTPDTLPGLRRALEIVEERIAATERQAKKDFWRSRNFRWGHHLNALSNLASVIEEEIEKANTTSTNLKESP